MNKQTNDYLEEYFEEHREDFFDEEPAFGHFNRFSQRLDQLHAHGDIASTQNKWGNLQYLFQKPWVQYAAATCALIITIITGFNVFQSTSDFEQLSNVEVQTLPSQATNLSYVSGAETLATNNTLEKVKDLEVEYLELKYQYSTTYDSAILEKIKENLTKRSYYIELLKKQSDYVSNSIFDADYLINQEECCGGHTYSQYSQIQSNDLYGKIIPASY